MIVRRALDFEMVGKRRCERPKMRWKRHVVKQVLEIGLKRKMPLTDQSAML